MRYGTIPIVRATGGLRDTVAPFDATTRQGVGFVFSEPTSDALLDAVQTATSIFAEKTVWPQLQRNAMLGDFSWDRSAARYVELYHQVVEEKQQQRRGV
jgi:starch synthase